MNAMKPIVRITLGALAIVAALGATILIKPAGSYTATRQVQTPDTPRTNPYERADRLLTQGRPLDAAAEIRRVREETDLKGQATAKLATALLEAGRIREAVAELISLTRIDPRRESFSPLTTGQVHARLASLALDMGDTALLKRTLEDFGRMERNQAQSLQTVSSAQAGAVDPNDGAPTLVKLARALDGMHDIAARDRMFELALRERPDPETTYAYGEALTGSLQARACLRVFTSFRGPVPDKHKSVVGEEVRRLRLYLKGAPEMTEEQERAWAIKKMAPIREDVKLGLGL